MNKVNINKIFHLKMINIIIMKKTTEDKNNYKRY